MAHKKLNICGFKFQYLIRKQCLRKLFGGGDKTRWCGVNIPPQSHCTVMATTVRALVQ